MRRYSAVGMALCLVAIAVTWGTQGVFPLAFAFFFIVLAVCYAWSEK